MWIFLLLNDFIVKTTAAFSPSCVKQWNPASLSWLTHKWTDRQLWPTSESWNLWLRRNRTHIDAIHSRYASSSGWPRGASGADWAPLQSKHKNQFSFFFSLKFISKYHPVLLLLVWTAAHTECHCLGDVRGKVMKLNLVSHYGPIIPPNNGMCSDYCCCLDLIGARCARWDEWTTVCTSF